MSTTPERDLSGLLHKSRNMAHSICSVCKNLEYDRFVKARCTDLDGDLTRPRYLVIEFDDLQAAAMRGCTTCDILNQGIRLSWGDSFEDKYNRHKNKYTLILKCSRGMGLLLFKCFREHWESLLDCPLNHSIEFFTPQNSLPFHPAFGHAKYVPRTLTATSAAVLLRSWLDSCDKKHTLCRSAPTSIPAPCRMLDITLDIPRLVEISRDQVSERIYVTMSHCWGMKQPTRTTKENIKFRREGVELKDLSPLFRAAIQLCKMIGCNLLWIDSLCIIQDDENDWLEQSQKMAEIYSNAYFNIGATSLPDSDGSLFHERWMGKSDLPLSTYSLGSLDHPVLVRDSHSYNHALVQGWRFELGARGPPGAPRPQAPLMTRAWIFQEILLARRTLHICASELIWECMTTYTCECKSHPWDTERSGYSLEAGHRPSPLPLKHEFTQIQKGHFSSSGATWEFWLRASDWYSSLLLTNASDRFFAILGIAKVVRELTNGTYLAGLWAEDLPRALLWTGLPRSDPRASRTDDAPTWSWMSRRVYGADGNSNCHMSYRPVLEDGFVQEPRTGIRWLGKPEAGLSSLVPLTKDMFAIEIEAPTLKLRVLPATGVWRDMGHKFSVHSISGDRFSMVKSFSFSLWADCPGELSDLRNETMCLVEGFIMGKCEKTEMTQVLVLKKDDKLQGNVYKRLGISVFLAYEDPHGYQDFLSTAEVRKIIVI